MPRLLAAPMAAALAAVLLLLQACAANATTAPRRLMKEPSVAKAEGPRPIDDGLGTIAPDPVPATGRFGAQLDELHGQSKHGVYEAHGYGYGHIGYGYGSYGGYGGPAKVHSFLGKPVSSDPPVSSGGECAGLVAIVVWSKRRDDEGTEQYHLCFPSLFTGVLVTI
jgi:hypothetical protein